jgi:hypothetical protein
MNKNIILTDFVSYKDSKRYELIIDLSSEISDDWCGKIYEKGKEFDDYFSVILREMENQSELKIVDLFPDCKRYYLGKGISVNIIIYLKNYFNKRIISSSNLKANNFYTEYNSDSAITNVWEKLKNLNEVEYDEEQDTYYTIP